VVKCRRRPCGGPKKDADGDFDVDATNDGSPFCDGECDDGQVSSDDFNPKSLLEKLCPGGNCAPRPRPVPNQSQTGS